MKSLIIDFHGGCISILTQMLAKTPKNLTSIAPVTDQTRILKLNGVEKFILESQIIHKLRVSLGLARNWNHNQALIRKSVKKQSKRTPTFSHRAFRGNIYDVAWISFPPALYRRVKRAKIAKHIVVNISHRMDLWLKSPSARRQLWDEVKQDLLADNVTFIATNEYDQKYFEYYTGAKIELIKPVAHNALVRMMPADTKYEILIGPVNLDRSHEIVLEIMGLSPSVTPILAKYKTFTFQDLASHPALILIPYSIYSISLVEYESLGIPLLIPSDQWLIANGILDDVKLFPKYGQRKKIQKFREDALPSSPNADEILEWLQFAYWKQISNVHVWDSYEELLDLIGNIDKLKYASATKLMIERQRKFDKFVESIEEKIHG